MQARDSFYGANARAFNEQLNCEQRFIFRHGHWRKQPRMIFSERLAAPRAAKALKAIAMFAEFLGFDVARCAIHKRRLQQALAVVKAILWITWDKLSQVIENRTH